MHITFTTVIRFNYYSPLGYFIFWQKKSILECCKVCDLYVKGHKSKNFGLKNVISCNCKFFSQIEIIYHILQFAVTWIVHSALRGSENMIMIMLIVCWQNISLTKTLMEVCNISFFFLVIKYIRCLLSLLLVLQIPLIYAWKVHCAYLCEYIAAVYVCIVLIVNIFFCRQHIWFGNNSKWWNHKVKQVSMCYELKHLACSMLEKIKRRIQLRMTDSMLLASIYWKIKFNTRKIGPALLYKIT